MIWLVARREIVERVRERAFAIGTAVTIVILAAVVLLPTLLGGGDTKVTVRPVGPQAERVFVAAAAADTPFGVRLVRAKDKPDIVLRADRITRRGGTAKGAVAALQAASARLRARAAPPPPLPVVTTSADTEDRQGFAFIALIVLYGQLITYGVWVAMGIVEEKTSRIVEIILSTIRPRELLVGKVAGIGLVGLGQLLFIGAVGLTLALVSRHVHVGPHELAALPIVLAWFVLGFALYACAFAVVGALVPRQEDIQSTATPVTLVLLGSFFLSFSAASDPGSGLAQVLTFIPTSSPLVVPVRIIAGSVPWWEVVISVTLLLATIAALIVVAGRVYSNAVLQTGSKVRLRAAWRGADS